MSRPPEKIEDLNPDAQRLFYEASKEWVMSLKARHDPGDMIGILEDDPERYPYQAIGEALVPSYRPSPEDVQTAGSEKVIEAAILEGVRSDAEGIMGPGAFDKFVGGMIASRNLPAHPESMLKTMWGHMRVPRSNVSIVAYHPNIMALPIYSGAFAAALSRAEFNADDFNLFEFSRQNLLIVNPALSVASFKGQPVMEGLSRFTTIIQAVPPTRSGFGYYTDKSVRRIMSRATKDAMTGYLQNLYAENKSACLTVDPTGSTFEQVIEDGRVTALKRKPINRIAQDMIINDFHIAWPMTMVLKKEGAAWNIGEINSLFNDDQFGEMIDELDSQTEELAGVDLITAGATRAAGRLAVSNSGS